MHLYIGCGNHEIKKIFNGRAMTVPALVTNVRDDARIKLIVLSYKMPIGIVKQEWNSDGEYNSNVYQGCQAR